MEFTRNELLEVSTNISEKEILIVLIFQYGNHPFDFIFGWTTSKLLEFVNGVPYVGENTSVSEIVGVGFGLPEKL